MEVENINKYKIMVYMIKSEGTERQRMQNTYTFHTRVVKKQQQNHMLKQWCWVNGWHPAKPKPSREFALSGDKNGAHWWLLCSLCHGDPLRAILEKSPQKLRWCGLSFTACIDRGTPATPVCDGARGVARTVHLLPRVLMKCHELREYWFKLTILFVLQESCMFFPEERLKNQTQIHTRSHQFWGCCLLLSHLMPLFLLTVEAYFGYHNVLLGPSQLEEKRRPFYSHFIPRRRGIHLVHVESYIPDLFGSLLETYANNLFYFA